ncbi:MAG: carbonic anhydrase [Gemmatimonadales bacterium]
MNPPTAAAQAQLRLREGNDRFVSHNRDQSKPPGRDDQRPFAIILGCSDSRVPPEKIFDQGFGDLFVVRVAGNIAGPTQIASVEFAASQFGTRLVVVLGHSQCGAVLATLEQLEGETHQAFPNTHPIIEFIRPAVESLLFTELADDREALVRHAVRANVEASVERLRRSEGLKRLIDEDGLAVMAAMYSLETGRVEFFDDR